MFKFCNFKKIFLLVMLLFFGQTTTIFSMERPYRAMEAGAEIAVMDEAPANEAEPTEMQLQIERLVEDFGKLSPPEQVESMPILNGIAESLERKDHNCLQQLHEVKNILEEHQEQHIENIRLL